MGALKNSSWIFFTFLFLILFVIQVDPGACHCLESERDHLLHLKASLKLAHDGQNSTKLVTWNQSLDCCSWSGVGCSEDGRVISLDLSRELIVEGIDGDSSSIFSFKYLESLNLAYNAFDSKFPAKFGELSNLKYLNLSDSGFSGQIPIVISRLVNLQTLDISNTWLTLENPNLNTLIRNLSSLRELHLDGVNISTKDDSWGQAISSSLPNLRVLSLLQCDLKGSVAPSLSMLRHLSEIRLAGNDLQGIFPQEIFQLQSLRAIDLTGNINLEGSLPEFSTNSSIEELVLTYTKFSGELPYSIGNLKCLSRLDISYCRFSGEIPKSLSNLTRLTQLELSNNGFVGTIPSFTLLSNLTYLSLSDNYFLTGSIHSTHWEALTKLKDLDLSTNSLNGSIPRSVFWLPSLTSLALWENQFSEISNEHLNMSSSSSQLYELDLRNNNFKGPFPHLLFQLKQLTYIDLSYNNFNGIFNLSAIKHFKDLKQIQLSYSGLSVVDDYIELPNSPSYLSALSLASCGLTSFPRILRNAPYLYYLDFSQNQITGEIPPWLWEVPFYFSLNLSHNFLEGMGVASPVVNIPIIQYLDLHSNRLRGELPFFPRDARYLDYSMNNFSSEISKSIIGSSYLLDFLSLANNNFRGSIPESICNNSEIRVLDLSNNSLSGPIPQCLSLLKKSLDVLNLGMNHLNGTISDELFQPDCQLETLDLSGNRLTGKVPKSLLNCKGLHVLNLGNNQIGGNFPCWLQEISTLTVVVLRSNEFHGELKCPSKTKETWPKLQIMDLSSNSFTGKLFPEWFLSWKAMIVASESKPIFNIPLGGVYQAGYYQDVVTLNLKGNEVKLEKILTIYTSIDLSGNNIEGGIPQELGDLKALYCLNLSRNNLVGQIPPSLGSLKQLESLDLSQNKLIGSIPRQLADLYYLAVLNLSFNQLEGPVPRGSQFDNMCEDSFLGNKGLVGPQVTRKCKGDRTTSVASPPTSLYFHDSNTRRQKKSEEIMWELTGAEVGFTCGLGAVIGSLVFWRRWRNWYFYHVDQFLLRILFPHRQRRPNQLRTRVRN